MGRVEAPSIMVLPMAILEVVVLTFVILALLEVLVPTRQEGLYSKRVTGIIFVKMGDQHNAIYVVSSIIGFLSVLTAPNIRNHLPGMYLPSKLSNASSSKGFPLLCRC